MKLVPAIRFPLRKKQTIPAEGAPPPDSPPKETVTFYLRSSVEDDGKTKRYFYECTHEGCHGCGCPSFTTADLKNGTEIPDEVLEHMARHTGFAHWSD